MGGAFDPIHIGHLNQARKLIDLGYVKGIVFMPTYMNQFGKKMSDFVHRLNMINLCLTDRYNDYNCIKSSDFEIRHQITGGTYDVIRTIIEEGETFGFRPPIELSYIIGIDQANEIHRWQYWQELLNLVTFIVLNRQKDGMDIEPNSLWFLKEPHYFVDLGGDVPGNDVSSTNIRELVRKRDNSFKYLVNPDVYYYILNNNLYSEKEEPL
jgi:nicotinate-nucleotide adenylyltransferase